MRELLLSALWRSPKQWGLAPERVQVGEGQVVAVLQKFCNTHI